MEKEEREKQLNNYVKTNNIRDVFNFKRTYPIMIFFGNDDNRFFFLKSI